MYVRFGRKVDILLPWFPENYLENLWDQGNILWRFALNRMSCKISSHSDWATPRKYAFPPWCRHLEFQLAVWFSLLVSTLNLAKKQYLASIIVDKLVRVRVFAQGKWNLHSRSTVSSPLSPTRPWWRMLTNGSEVRQIRVASSETQGQIVGQAGNWGERNRLRRGRGAGRKGEGEKRALFSPSPFPAAPSPSAVVSARPSFPPAPRFAPGSPRMIRVAAVSDWHRDDLFVPDGRLDLYGPIMASGVCCELLKFW